MQETTRGAHQGPEMGARVKEVCVGGVEKSWKERLQCSQAAKSKRFARPLRASRKPRGNSGSPGEILEPRPCGRRVRVRLLRLPREALSVVLFKAADPGYQDRSKTK